MRALDGQDRLRAADRFDSGVRVRDIGTDVHRKARRIGRILLRAHRLFHLPGDVRDLILFEGSHQKQRFLSFQLRREDIRKALIRAFLPGGHTLQLIERQGRAGMALRRDIVRPHAHRRHPADLVV